jgi:hypothetical protein
MLQHRPLYTEGIFPFQIIFSSFSASKYRSQIMLISFLVQFSARNGNLEVAVYFLKAKHGYTVRKLKKNRWILS